VVCVVDLCWFDVDGFGGRVLFNGCHDDKSMMFYRSFKRKGLEVVGVWGAERTPLFWMMSIAVKSRDGMLTDKD
jgi:hypothetical protein